MSSPTTSGDNDARPGVSAQARTPKRQVGAAETTAFASDAVKVAIPHFVGG